MELLKWLSYGVWDKPISADEYCIVKSFAITFLVLVILKTVLIFLVKDQHMMTRGNPWGYSFLGIARLLQGLFYLLLFPILGLFQTVGLYFLVILIGGYCIVIMIASMDTEHNNEYVWEINGKIQSKCNEWGLIIEKKRELKRNFNLIDKTIYDYRKKAIIG